MTRKDQIVEFVRKQGQPVRRGDVAEEMDVKENYAGKLLSQLEKDGRLTRVTQGQYDLPERHESGTELDAGEGVDTLFKEQATMTVYTDVKAEAGSGRVVYPDEAEHTIELPRHFISRILGFSPPREVGVMTADGDSMRPTIQDGDLILYRPAEEVRGGGVYVLLIDDRQIVKRVQTISGGGYRIISDNSYHGYADETLVPADDHTDALVNEETGRSVDLRVVGSVIFPRRDTDHLHVQQVAEIIRGMTNGDPMQQLRAQKS